VITTYQLPSIHQRVRLLPVALWHDVCVCNLPGDNYIVPPSKARCLDAAQQTTYVTNQHIPNTQYTCGAASATFLWKYDSTAWEQRIPSVGSWLRGPSHNHHTTGCNEPSQNTNLAYVDHYCMDLTWTAVASDSMRALCPAAAVLLVVPQVAARCCLPVPHLFDQWPVMRADAMQHIQLRPLHIDLQQCHLPAIFAT
jgi:hypothetical protein